MNNCSIWLVLLPVRRVAERLTYPGYARLPAPCGQTKILRHLAQLFIGVASVHFQQAEVEAEILFEAAIRL